MRRGGAARTGAGARRSDPLLGAAAAAEALERALRNALARGDRLSARTLERLEAALGAASFGAARLREAAELETETRSERRSDLDWEAASAAPAALRRDRPAPDVRADDDMTEF